MYSDSEYIMISALQHYLFCPRQCALIHVEGYWADNTLTALGDCLHERVDTPGKRYESGTKTEYSVPVASERLGISGVMDLIEYVRDDDGVRRPVIVEYKHGKPKKNHCDEVQLCAQAMCVEEMLKIEIPRGTLYYGKDRKRHIVEFDSALRNLTEKTIAAVHDLVSKGLMPNAYYSPELCDNCSLVNYCRPNDNALCDAYVENILCENS